MSTRRHLRGWEGRAGPRAHLGAPPGLAHSTGCTEGPGAPGTLPDSPPARSPARGSPGKLTNAHTHPRNLQSCSLYPQKAPCVFRWEEESWGKMLHVCFPFRKQRGGWKGGFNHLDCKIHAERKRDLPAEPGEKFGRRGWEAGAACAPSHGPQRQGDPRAGGRSPTWKCWKKAEMRVICKLRHLEEQRARWTLTADRDSSSRRAAAAPGPPARQPAETASQRQRVRAAPGAPGTMAAGQGRGGRALAEAPSSAPGPHCREPGGRRNSTGKFNHSTPAPRPPRQPPPRSASRGGVRVTGGLAIGWKESE